MTYDDKLTECLDKHGAFFAVSNKQFEEKRVEGVEYVSMGANLICPADNAHDLYTAINKLSDERIADDLANNSKRDIIWRELANHEAQITGSIDSTVDALEGYNFTREEIKEVYNDYFSHCVENDLF